MSHEVILEKLSEKESIILDSLPARRKMNSVDRPPRLQKQRELHSLSKVNGEACNKGKFNTSLASSLIVNFTSLSLSSRR
mmetsp:Transcript_40820/g.64726  ORF Transcript_40820/g.64726 Transcript_40820/m.64726 type:complete len:80 (+) Transcript_40820:95-334(+)